MLGPGGSSDIKKTYSSSSKCLQNRKNLGFLCDSEQTIHGSAIALPKSLVDFFRVYGFEMGGVTKKNLILFLKRFTFKPFLNKVLYLV